MRTLRFNHFAARLNKLFLGFAAFAVLSWISVSAAKTDAKPAAHTGTYKLRPMDLLKIQVFQEPDLERELRVSQDSTIMVPLVGSINVKDRTVRETELLLTELYQQDYLVNPQINVTVVEYAQRTINVLGAVNAPGSIPIPPEKNLNLLEAIARSGGFSRLANRNRVSLTRTQADGHTSNYTVDADQLVSGDAGSRAPVQDGDVIYVPERIL